jgi:DNA-binding MarR family transcriptional regulator
MGQIAQRSRLSKQTMTTLVRMCERDGLVVRERDPEDSRAFRVHLSRRARVQTRRRRGPARARRPPAGGAGQRQRDALVRALKGVMDL